MYCNYGLLAGTILLFDLISWYLLFWTLFILVCFLVLSEALHALTGPGAMDALFIS